jgi:hypothetical protein
MLFDDLEKLLLSILRTSKEFLIGENDVGEGPYMFDNFGDIHHVGNVDAAPADEHTDTGLLV